MKQLFILAFALVTLAACGGNVVVDAPTGGGGAGGTASQMDSTSDGVPNPTTGGWGCDSTYTCAEALNSLASVPTKLCDGTIAQKRFFALIACTCTGACSTKCGANLCAGSHQASSLCLTCITATGCDKEFNECVNDT